MCMHLLGCREFPPENLRSHHSRPLRRAGYLRPPHRRSHLIPYSGPQLLVVRECSASQVDLKRHSSHFISYLFNNRIRAAVYSPGSAADGRLAPSQAFSASYCLWNIHFPKLPKKSIDSALETVYFAYVPSCSKLVWARLGGILEDRLFCFCLPAGVSSLPASRSEE